MKILCVALNHFPEQTGIGKYQGEMAAWLVKRGHDVRIVTAPPYYPQWKIEAPYSAWKYKRETIDGASVYRIPLYVPAVPSGLKRMVHLISFTVAAFPVIFWQSIAWRPDVVISTAPPLSVAPVVVVCGWLSRARTLLHMQDFEVEAAFGLGLLKRPKLFKFALWAEKKIMLGFDKVSTISRRMRERLIAKGVPEERTLLIANWANIEDFDPEFGSGEWGGLKTSPDTVLAVYAGNMGKKQGLETIVEAAKLLTDKPNIRFIVCGDGSGRQEMVEQAKGLNNITFFPVQQWTEFRHLMIGADIHLLPQRIEAADLVMPSKLGNILASGRPVVAGAGQGTQIYDAVQGCGIAVEPDNAKDFAEAIATLAADKELRANMGAEGRRKAFTEWGRDSILERLEKALQA